MLEKSELLVLHKMRYDENAIIVRTYTRSRGALSFLVRSSHGKKTRTPASVMRPMALATAEMNVKSRGDLHSLRELSLLCVPESDIKTNAVACFVAEVVLRTQTNPQPDERLYDYLREVSVQLSQLLEPAVLSNLPLEFLSRYAELLGIGIPRDSILPEGNTSSRLRALLDYYAFHLERPLNLRALDVLHQVFNS